MKNDLNSVLIEGELIENPVGSHTSQGTPRCQFEVITVRFPNREDSVVREASIFTVKVVGKQAEICMEHLRKDRGVRVVGRLKQETWEDDMSRSREKVYIVAEHVEFKPKPKTPNDKPEDQKVKEMVPFHGEPESMEQGQ